MIERAARALYTLLWWLALPWALLRVLWRGRGEPGYRERLGERIGIFRGPARAPDAPHPIWIHAVSLGETRAIAPLVERIASLDPAVPIVLTHTTATGRAAGRELFGTRVTQAWLPYDLPCAMRRFLDHFAPRAGLLAETELWPNLAAAATARGVPVFLVNARLSARSASGYAKISILSRPLIRSLAGVAAQGDADAERLRELGAREVTVTGNLKFDARIAPELRERGKALRALIGAARPSLVAASTREGEEALILDAWARQPSLLPPRALLVIVPRHPQRFDAVAALLDARGVRFGRRSDGGSLPAGATVFLGDTMGELPAYYAAADVAFVGGSLLPFGGQNLIEPLSLGVPTLIGPHTFNFTDAASAAIAAGAARRAADAGAVVAAAAEILASTEMRESMHHAAERFIAAHRGADARLWAWLAPRLRV